jgi:hypothetical protein
MPLVTVLWIAYAGVLALVLVVALVVVAVAFLRLGRVLGDVQAGLADAAEGAAPLSEHLAGLHEALGGKPEELGRIRTRQFPAKELATFEPRRQTSQVPPG